MTPRPGVSRSIASPIQFPMPRPSPTQLLRPALICLALTAAVACSEAESRSPVTDAESAETESAGSGHTVLQFLDALRDSRVTDAKALLASGVVAKAGAPAIDQLMVKLSSDLAGAADPESIVISDETKGDLGLVVVAQTLVSGRRDTMSVAMQREDGAWRVALHLQTSDVEHVSPSYQARSAIKTQLRNVLSAQEGYFADHGTYAADVGSLGYALSTGFAVAVNRTESGRGYTATATSTEFPDVSCRTRVGNAPGVEAEGVLLCE